MAIVQPNYPQDLASLYANGNPFLAQQGQQQFDLAQQQAQQNLGAGAFDLEKQKAMLPIEQEQGRALAEQYRGSGALSQAHANKADYELGILKQVPVSDQIKGMMADISSKVSGADKAKLDVEMGNLRKYASAALSNGGSLPLSTMSEMQQNHPNLVQYFTQPGGAKVAAQMVVAHNQLDPEYAKATESARIHAAGSTGAAAISAAAQERMNRANIDAGKFNHFNTQFLIDKGKAGSFDQQAGAWQMEAEQAGQAAAATTDPSEKAYWIQKANVAAQNAEQAKQNALNKAAASAEEANRAKINPSSVNKNFQTVSPARNVTPATSSNNPTVSNNKSNNPTWTVEVIK
jgi:hypothetical protein